MPPLQHCPCHLAPITALILVMDSVMMVARDQCTVCVRMAQIALTVVTATLIPATTLALTPRMASVMMVVQDRCTVCAAMEVIALIVVVGIQWPICHQSKRLKLQ
jgi:hypothetical protein